MNRISDKNFRSWTTAHAFLVLAGTLISLLISNLIPLVFITIISFFILIYSKKSSWTKSSHFGLANTITAFRLFLISLTSLFFTDIPNTLIAIIGLLILIGDGLDGKIAQIRGEVSTFGEYFDKEVDAFFMHAWILMAILKSLIWPWTILLGLLRYLFIIYLFILGEREKKERRSKWGRYIYVYVICSILTVYLPLPALYKPAIVLAAIFLLYSFGRDLVWIHSKN
jgi:phosphatidylglycerophosphate synthase